jgi:hypothetical protein
MKAELTKSDYYFITFAWKHPHPDVPWQVENTVIDIDPIQWVLEVEKSDKDECSYRLLFYRRISAEKFKKFNGRI